MRILPNVSIFLVSYDINLTVLPVVGMSVIKQQCGCFDICQSSIRCARNKTKFEKEYLSVQENAITNIIVFKITFSHTETTLLYSVQ